MVDGLTNEELCFVHVEDTVRKRGCIKGSRMLALMIKPFSYAVGNGANDGASIVSFRGKNVQLGVLMNH